MTQTQLAKKLSLGSLGLEKATLVALLADKKEGHVERIAYMIGKADACKISANKQDPSKNDVKFIGQFEGHNLLTGEVVVSPACYLPGGVDEMIQVALDKSDGGVEFAFQVAVKKKSDAITGYVFQVSAAADPKENDPLQALRERLGVSAPAPALPAPDAAATEKKGSKAKKDA